MTSPPFTFTVVLFVSAIVLYSDPSTAVGPSQVSPVHLNIADRDGVIGNDEKPKIILESGVDAFSLRTMFLNLNERLFGHFSRRVTFPLSIIACETDTCFSGYHESSLISGLAIPRKNLIVLHLGRLAFDQDRVRSTLLHEAIHILIGQMVGQGGGAIPRWFDEGVASSFSGDISELRSAERAARVFSSAVLGGHLFRFRDISTRFPNHEDDLILAYEQSRRFVRYIIDEYGKVFLLDLFGRLSAGMDFEYAFRKTYGVDQEVLMIRWKEGLFLDEGLFLSIIGFFDEILFTIVGILFAIGLVIARRRHKRAMEALDDDRPPPGRIYH